MKKSSKSKKSAQKKKTVVVDRKFLIDLANRIYDPKSKKFLRLCNGTLQNGPDPTDEKRPMHCGLGELYFACTGKQPGETGIDEAGVVELAVEMSTVNGVAKIAKEKAIVTIEALKIPDGVKFALSDEIERAHAAGEFDEAEDSFRRALDNIPEENDDGCADNKCTITTYKARSKRVAEQLREAANFLPK